jgi:hypothetical protein
VYSVQHARVLTLALAGLYLYSLAPTELLTRFMGNQNAVTKRKKDA